ncbi:MAG TPA: tetratricopeptide repeat protein [Pyrinomonadaceae bacterium]|nr:tetratricopeptide repeat protein [Pyrinomonadaceae bacterium]
MKADMPISNCSETNERSARGRRLRLLSMALALVCCLASAQAQNDLTSKPAPGGSSATAPAATAEKTRSGRVAETPETTSGDESSEINSAQAQPNADGKGVDRLSVLRSQIEGAKTDAERMRLQRTLVDYLVALNRKSEAVDELRAWSHAERLDPIGFYNLGNALARLGDTDTAIEAYRKAIKQRHGNYTRALNNLGVVLLRQGRWDEAQESLLSALRLEDFRYGEASYNLGRLYSMRGEADLAIREWRRALAVEPDHADAAIALARALAEDGNPERGLAVLDTFIARRGPSNELAGARREILFGGVSETAKAASLNAPGTPNSSAAIVVARDSASNLATANVKSGGGKRDAESLRPLKVSNETYDLLQRARGAREDGRSDEAIKFYRRVLSVNGGFLPPANLELSFVFSTMKRYDEAAATLTALTSREGARYPIAYYHLGRQYEALGELRLAAEAYEKAAAAFGDSNPQFLLDVSRTREKEGNTAAALVAMEAYVRISQSRGRAPEWSTERLTQLRQKMGATKN